MSLSNVIDRILGKQQSRQAARAADFRGIVAQIADGHEPDVDHVDAILHDAGKSLDDLRQAVEQLQHRRQLKDQCKQLPALAAERKDVEAKIDAANKALDEADTHHTDVTVPLNARLQEIRDQQWAAEAAKQELWSTCSDPVLKAKHAEAEKALADAHQNLANLRMQIDDWKAQVRSDRAVAERAKNILNGEKQVEEALSRARQHERKLAECETQLAKAEKAVTGLERQEAAVREQMVLA
jgi:chromosome segregation ATPase